MSAKVIHRVFVSSTYEDLREERAAVQKALLKLDCFPVGMELFAAADDETWEFLKRQIAESDYYIVIIAGRYGSVDTQGVSFTEKEYEYARSIGKPSVGFLHADPGKIAAEKTDPENHNKLAAFKARVQTSITAKFSTPHELANEVIVSVVNLRDRYPAPGFVRANEVADAAKYAALLEENAKLKADLDQVRVETPFVEASNPWTFDLRRLDRATNAPEILSVNATLGQIFYRWADKLLLAQPKSYALESEIASALIKGAHFSDKDRGLVPLLLKQFVAAGLVESYMAPDVKGAAQRWRLTDYGRTQYRLLATSPTFAAPVAT